MNDLGLGSFGYSMPQFPQLQSGENVLLPHMAVVRTKYNTVPTSLLGKTEFYTNEKWSEHTHCPQGRPQMTWPWGGDILLTSLISLSE